MGYIYQGEERERNAFCIRVFPNIHYIGRLHSSTCTGFTSSSGPVWIRGRTRVATGDHSWWGAEGPPRRGSSWEEEAQEWPRRGSSVIVGGRGSEPHAASGSRLWLGPDLGSPVTLAGLRGSSVQAIALYGTQSRKAQRQGDCRSSTEEGQSCRRGTRAGAPHVQRYRSVQYKSTLR